MRTRIPLSDTQQGAIWQVASCRLVARTRQESRHVGYHSTWHGSRVLRALLCLHAPVRQALKERPMFFDYALSGAVTVLIAAYLVYALIRPERF